MPKRVPLKNDDELQEAAFHVAFEIRMFRKAWARLDQYSPSLGNNNACASNFLAVSSFGQGVGAVGMPTVLIDGADFLTIEALLLHFRNLMEFFFTKAPEKDDLVLAKHYVGGPSWAIPAWEEEFRAKCNNLLAHLTYRRSFYLGRNAHHWYELPARVSSMETTISQFLDALAPERRSWFT